MTWRPSPVVPWRWLLPWCVACTVDPTLPCAPRAADSDDDDVLGFYQCVDAHLAGGEGCGAEGYPLGFGGRYGQRYWDEAPDHLSEAGVAWIHRVAACLQVALVEAVDATSTCDEVRAAGFASHDGCYLDTGFCELSLADQLWVVSIVDPADRERPEVQAMMTSVLDGCAARAR